MSIPDLILHSGKIITLDRASTVSEAVYVRGGRIVAVGSDKDVLDLAESGTRRIDLQQGSVLPGINDSHIHLQFFGLSQPPFNLDLSHRAVSSIAEIRELVAKRASESAAGTWIQGWGWSEHNLADVTARGYAPTRADLDDVSPQHPVLLTHYSGHAALANTPALRAAGITSATPDPEGGRIVRDSTSGEPTGELHEAAVALVADRIPDPTPQQRQEAVRSALATLNSLGVTSVTDPVVTPPMLRDYQALHRSEELTARITTLLNWTWPSVGTSTATIEHALQYVGVASGLGDDWLRVGGCKVFADGVPTLRSAWTARPYADGCCGSLVTEGATEDDRLSTLTAVIDLLHRHRLQAQVHATGDRACDAVVESFVASMKADPWPDARHVLIHANLPSEESMRQMAEHGFVANTNLLIKWQISDALRARIDDESWHRTMPVRSLLEHGVVVADSSDAPVTYPDWRQAIETLVLRETRGSGAVSGPNQRIDREQALRAWTTAPAYQEGTENRKGSIEIGKLADLTVVAEDFHAVDDHELHALTPILTVVDGKVVSEA
jgi:predicted amidohydrolase YtcJ